MRVSGGHGHARQTLLPEGKEATASGPVNSVEADTSLELYNGEKGEGLLEESEEKGRL